jgi:hypothetical protein
MGTAEPVCLYPPVERGDYGTVRIMAGEYAGQWGYYSGDEDDVHAVVWPGGPLGMRFLVIPRQCLALTMEGNDIIAEWGEAYPRLARARRIIVRTFAS